MWRGAPPGGGGGRAAAGAAGGRVGAAPTVAGTARAGPPPPEALPALVAAVEGGADLAVASRYVAGGRITQWPVWRRLASRVGTTGARTLLRPPGRGPPSRAFAPR